MHKRFLGAALAMGALLAGSQATQTAATSQPDLQQTRDVAAKSWPVSIRAQKPAPTKPANPATKHLEEIAYRPVAGLTPVRFFERPGRRKVKYGKSRWVILG